MEDPFALPQIQGTLTYSDLEAGTVNAEIETALGDALAKLKAFVREHHVARISQHRLANGSYTSLLGYSAAEIVASNELLKLFDRVVRDVADGVPSQRDNILQLRFAPAARLRDIRPDVYATLAWQQNDSISNVVAEVADDDFKQHVYRILRAVPMDADVAAWDFEMCVRQRIERGLDAGDTVYQRLYWSSSKRAAGVTMAAFALPRAKTTLPSKTTAATRAFGTPSTETSRTAKDLANDVAAFVKEGLRLSKTAEALILRATGLAGQLQNAASVVKEVRRITEAFTSIVLPVVEANRPPAVKVEDDPFAELEVDLYFDDLLNMHAKAAEEGAAAVLAAKDAIGAQQPLNKLRSARKGAKAMRDAIKRAVEGLEQGLRRVEGILASSGPEGPSPLTTAPSAAKAAVSKPSTLMGASGDSTKPLAPPAGGGSTATVVSASTAPGSGKASVSAESLATTTTTTTTTATGSAARSSVATGFAPAGNPADVRAATDAVSELIRRLGDIDKAQGDPSDADFMAIKKDAKRSTATAFALSKSISASNSSAQDLSAIKSSAEQQTPIVTGLADRLKALAFTQLENARERLATAEDDAKKLAQDFAPLAERPTDAPAAALKTTIEAIDRKRDRLKGDIARLTSPLYLSSLPGELKTRAHEVAQGVSKLATDLAGARKRLSDLTVATLRGPPSAVVPVSPEQSVGGLRNFLARSAILKADAAAADARATRPRKSGLTLPGETAPGGAPLLATQEDLTSATPAARESGTAAAAAATSVSVRAPPPESGDSAKKSTGSAVPSPTPGATATTTTTTTNPTAQGEVSASGSSAKKSAGQASTPLRAEATSPSSSSAITATTGTATTSPATQGEEGGQPAGSKPPLAAPSAVVGAGGTKAEESTDVGEVPADTSPTASPPSPTEEKGGLLTRLASVFNPFGRLSVPALARVTNPSKIVPGSTGSPPLEPAVLRAPDDPRTLAEDVVSEATGILRLDAASFASAREASAMAEQKIASTDSTDYKKGVAALKQKADEVTLSVTQRAMQLSAISNDARAIVDTPGVLGDPYNKSAKEIHDRVKLLSKAARDDADAIRDAKAAVEGLQPPPRAAVGMSLLADIDAADGDGTSVSEGQLRLEETIDLKGVSRLESGSVFQMLPLSIAYIIRKGVNKLLLSGSTLSASIPYSRLHSLLWRVPYKSENGLVLWKAACACWGYARNPTNAGHVTARAYIKAGNTVLTFKRWKEMYENAKDWAKRIVVTGYNSILFGDGDMNRKARVVLLHQRRWLYSAQPTSIISDVVVQAHELSRVTQWADDMPRPWLQIYQRQGTALLHSIISDVSIMAPRREGAPIAPSQYVKLFNATAWAATVPPYAHDKGRDMVSPYDEDSGLLVTGKDAASHVAVATRVFYITRMRDGINHIDLALLALEKLAQANEYNSDQATTVIDILEYGLRLYATAARVLRNLTDGYTGDDAEDTASNSAVALVNKARHDCDAAAALGMPLRNDSYDAKILLQHARNAIAMLKRQAEGDTTMTNGAYAVWHPDGDDNRVLPVCPKKSDA